MQFNTESENQMPDPEWDLDHLAAYTRDRMEFAGILGRRTALQIWRAGLALLIVREKQKAERRWTEWCQAQNIPLSSAYEAMRVAERFENEVDIAGFTAIEAKLIAGTVRTKPKGGVTTVEPRDEHELTNETAEAASEDGDSGEVKPPSMPEAEMPPSPVSPPAGWFVRHLHELQEDVDEIEDTVLFVGEWAAREQHPMSAALLRVLIVADLVNVEIDDGKEVVRVVDHDLIAALAAAETFLDPLFSRLGITPGIAARHLLAMVREGRGFGPAPKKPSRKESRTS